MRRWWAADLDGRIMALDRSAVAAKAEERAEALLASLLDADDAERWRLDRRIFIPDDYTQHDLGFTIYVVAHNVYVVYGPRLIDKLRWPLETICTHSDPGLPLADRVATYVLLIRADLQGALGALRGVTPPGVVFVNDGAGSECLLSCPCPSCSPGSPLGRFFWRPGAGTRTVPPPGW